MADPFELFYLPFRPALDPNGLVVPGAKLAFFISGTNTPQTVYADAALTVPLDNPVEANAAGKWPPIYIDPSLLYRVLLSDALGATLDEVDPYVPGSVGGATGAAGAADNTYTALATFKASDIDRKAASLVGVPGVPDGRFYWTPGDFTSKADDTTYIAADDVPPAEGAWVRQGELFLRPAALLSSGAIDNDSIARAISIGSKFAPSWATKGVVFRINDEIVIPAGVCFDAGGATFQQITPGKNAFRLSDGSKIINATIIGPNGNLDGASFETSNGIFAEGAEHVVVEDCRISNFQHNGIYLRNCLFATVRNNTFYGNRYLSSTSADIMVWSASGTDVYRGAHLTGNRCYSNNSQGIYVSAGGSDQDIIINGNWCVALDYATAALVPQATLKRRWGIVLGYGQSAKTVICTDNLIRNTNSGGIYRQAGQTAGAINYPVIIKSNIIADTGLIPAGGPIQPGLSSGICLAAQGDGDLVEGNLVINSLDPTFGGSAGICVQPNGEPMQTASTMVRGNTIVGSASHSVAVVYGARNVTVEGNRSVGAERSDYYYSQTIVRSIAETFTLRGNSAIRPNTTAPAIQLGLNVSASNERIIVDGNVLTGAGLTATALENTGILFDANAVSAGLTIRNNEIGNFRHGIAPIFYVGSLLAAEITGNAIRACDTAYAFGSSTSAGMVYVQNDRSSGNTKKFGGGALGGNPIAFEVALNAGLPTLVSASPPTIGTWPAGAMTRTPTPTVGQPTAQYCTVAGAPGTWVAGANL